MWPSVGDFSNLCPNIDTSDLSVWDLKIGSDTIHGDLASHKSLWRVQFLLGQTQALLIDYIMIL
jgi:hypothetical protein